MYEEILNSDPVFLLDKAICYEKNNDYTNFAIYLTMACNLEDMTALQVFMEDAENERSFYNQDYNVTRSFYQETLKYACSSNNMGYLYEHGLGVPKNVEKAVELYTYSATKSFIPAILNLSSLYRDTLKDVKKAITIYKMGAKLGDSYCMNNLGYTYGHYKEVQNIDGAIKYLEMAIKYDNPLALDNLTSIYKVNLGIRDKKYIQDYYLNLGQEEQLKRIYGYTSDYITLLRENYELKKEMDNVKKENEEMKNHILASPDGILYFEALQQWKQRL